MLNYLLLVFQNFLMNNHNIYFKNTGKYYFYLIPDKMKIKYIVACLLGLQVWLSSCFNANKNISSHMSKEMKSSSQSFYDLKATSIEGKEVSLAEFKGKKVIILNVASECGYTPQYGDWQKFYENNREEVVVLGFPCNQFMGQEPGTEKEIASFCQKNYGVTFPLFEKIDVKGENQSPVYQWLSNPEKNGWCSEIPTWNFCKYLIDENGKLTNFFASGIKPDSPEFIQALSQQ
jgi:glutathione peroxidase